jgi:hypothetical protein
MSRSSSRERFFQKKLRSHRMKLTVRWVSRWKPAMMRGILRPAFSTRSVRSVRTFCRRFYSAWFVMPVWANPASKRTISLWCRQRIQACAALAVILPSHDRIDGGDDILTLDGMRGNAGNQTCFSVADGTVREGSERCRKGRWRDTCGKFKPRRGGELPCTFSIQNK